MRWLTAIPVYNEAQHIRPVLQAVTQYAPSILVVDDGSTDQTPDRLAEFPDIAIARHPKNRGYGAALKTAFQYTLDHNFDALVTLDCDGQHEPALIPNLIAPLADYDIVSGSRYLQVFDPAQQPPPERRRINVEVTRWLNECLNFNLTDAFCGFKAYRASALAQFKITDEGYAMPLELWVQAAARGLSIVEVPVPLIYLDASRAFGGSLDDPVARLKHYKTVMHGALQREGISLVGSCCE